MYEFQKDALLLALSRLLSMATLVLGSWQLRLSCNGACYAFSTSAFMPSNNVRFQDKFFLIQNVKYLANSALKSLKFRSPWWSVPAPSESDNPNPGIALYPLSTSTNKALVSQ